MTHTRLPLSLVRFYVMTFGFQIANITVECYSQRALNLTAFKQNTEINLNKNLNWTCICWK